QQAKQRSRLAQHRALAARCAADANNGKDVFWATTLVASWESMEKATAKNPNRSRGLSRGRPPEGSTPTLDAAPFSSVTLPSPSELHLPSFPLRASPYELTLRASLYERYLTSVALRALPYERNLASYREGGGIIGGVPKALGEFHSTDGTATEAGGGGISGVSGTPFVLP